MVPGPALSAVTSAAPAGTFGAAAPLLSNPITAIVGGALLGIQALFSIRAHHAAAVKNEAAALNAAVPAVTDTWKALFAGVEAGNITPAAAVAGVDQTLNQYESLVYDSYKVKRKAGNGPDYVEKTYLEPWAEKLKAMLASPEDIGSFTSESVRAHAGFSGIAPWSLNDPTTAGDTARGLATTPAVGTPAPAASASDLGASAAAAGSAASASPSAGGAVAPPATPEPAGSDRIYFGLPLGTWMVIGVMVALLSFLAGGHK